MAPEFMARSRTLSQEAAVEALREASVMLREEARKGGERSAREEGREACT
jgi:hypothetical protein